MIYLCCENDLRRNRVRDDPTLNGIDFLEVLDREAPAGSPRQRTLMVHLFKPVPALTLGNVVILGGDRIKPVKVEWIAQASTGPGNGAEQAFFSALPEAANVLVVRTDSDGDFSTYTLRFVISADNENPPADFDPAFAQVEFSFKVECPTDYDCLPQRICPETPPAEPDIDYLAKDYASFRRLMLDRMAQLMPAWRERSPADLGITLVELLAYVGDHLSYQQDAVATEAYLQTARRRVSVRRHARLVDYAMHDGCNARAWVQIQVDSDDVVLKPGTQLLTRVPQQSTVIPPASSLYDEAMRRNPLVFETVHEVTLYKAHEAIPFHTWLGQQCCLPRGAVRATLLGDFPKLRAGDVLIFEEICSPITGSEADADPKHRHAVRLVEVVTAIDPLANPPAVTEIRWGVDDALPFALCVSAKIGKDEVPVSVARGNIVLADHGRSIDGEAIGEVPEPHLFLPPDTSADRCQRPDRKAVPPRFRPTLAQGPLTQAAPYDAAAAAQAAMLSSLAAAQPKITLAGDFGGHIENWEPRHDLLASAGDEPLFVPEVENDGATALRFGDGRHGMRPESGTKFSASYRVGNSVAGNIGAEALTHVVTDAAGITKVRNPLPAHGGTEPETIAEMRTRAPYAFRTQERAVTPEDYGDVSERHAQVQQAAATFRWTGSWHTVFITIDRVHGLPINDEFETDMREHIEPFRMAGYDLEIDAPHFVPLEVEMWVCVKPDYFRSDVKQALVDLFSSRALPDGRLGLFHPDNFSFGQPVFLSRLYATAQSVPGVESVTITKFHRRDIADMKPLESGRIDFGRIEIARLDNDRNYPDRGTFRLELGGGK